jgi:uncharacterized protein
MTNTQSVLPKAAWKVTLDGTDLTNRFKPFLISVTVTEKRGGEADELEIVLDDKDGLLDLPKRGAILKVAMGWERGTGVTLGLIDKGEFKVDEAAWSGDPDQITIRARSADLTSEFRTRRERHFVAKTVKEIVSKIAADNGYTPHIDAALGAKVVPAIGSGAKSDAVFLKELGKRFDATATVKSARLIFAPIAKGQTASGASIPTVTLTRLDISRPRYSAIDRESYAGVEAVWHNKATGQRETVSHEVTSGGTPKRLRKVYANQADATHACEAEANRSGRAKGKFEGSLSLGQPHIYPDTPVTLSGYKAEIEAQKWVVAEDAHKMDGSGGLTSNLTLESTG